MIPRGALTGGQPYGNLASMQTTIHLDDALLAQAAKLAREKGCDLSHLIEETLREKVASVPRVNRNLSFAWPLWAAKASVPELISTTQPPCLP